MSDRIVVPGYGKVPNSVLIVGERPGEHESVALRPFVGRAGQEQARYLRREGFNLTRATAYVTNVCKDYIEGNADPTPSDIERWTPELVGEIARVRPQFTLAVGRFAVRWFLGDVDMDAVHGLPQSSPRAPGVVIPCFHPAYGFYDADARTLISYDYANAVAIINGHASAEPVVDEFVGSEEYLDVTGRQLASVIAGWDESAPIAIDTEGLLNSDWHWSIQVSAAIGTGLVLRSSQPDFEEGIAAIRSHTLSPASPATFIHSSMHDFHVTRSMGLDLFDCNLWDTRYAAYTTRIEPQGLKALARRRCGMMMNDYRDVVGNVALEKQLAYLGAILERDWPKPDGRVINNNDGTSEFYTPQPVGKRAEAILVDFYSGKTDRDGSLVDPMKRWRKVDRELRAMVERELGTMPIATLADIELNKALRYAARDPDATLRIGLRQLASKDKRYLSLCRDGNGVLPVFEEMQASGMLADREYCSRMSETMWAAMCRLQSRISHRYMQDRPFNPASSDQVATLMRRRGLVGEKRSRKTGKVSTAKKSIEHLRYTDDAIADVIDWREHQKMRDAFYGPIIERIGDNVRAYIHTDLNPYKVESRRISSSDPNLTAIPVRNELGIAVRDGFIAEPGCELGSWDLCLAPHTRVLTADLRWIPIRDVRRGDRLVAIDEHSVGRPRKLQTATVERLGYRVRACRRIRTSSGREIIASLEHPWLTRNKARFRLSGGKHGGAWQWVQTEDLRVGDALCKLAEPWETDQSWEAGWIAGFLDGEGCLNRRYAMISLTQKPGPTFDRARDFLSRRGFHKPYNRKTGGYAGSGTVNTSWVCGVIDCMSLIGTIRPQRFFDESIEKLWEGKELRRRYAKTISPNGFEPSDAIVSIEDVSAQAVVSMQTSTHTFVAEGYFTHNSQAEMRVMAGLSKDPLLARMFLEKRDPHAETAARIFGIDIRDVKEMEHRYPSKRAGFGIITNITGAGLLDQLRMFGCKGWDQESCDRLIVEWLKVYKGVATFLDACRAEVREKGVVYDYWGMPRYLPGVWSDDRKAVAESERAASSHKIQGGAQGMIQRSMIWLKPYIRGLREAGENVRWVLQIHDSVMFHYDSTLWDTLNPLIHEALTQHHDMAALGIPMDAKASRGTTWGKLK